MVRTQTVNSSRAGTPAVCAVLPGPSQHLAHGERSVGMSSGRKL